MTKKNIVLLQKILNKVSSKIVEKEKVPTGPWPSMKLKGGVLRLIQAISPEVKLLSEIEDSFIPDITPYNQEQMALLTKFKAIESIPGEGNFALPNITEEDKENITLFNKELDDLREKYKDAIAKYDERVVEYNKTLDEEVEVKLPTKMDMTDFPDWVEFKDISALLELGVIS